MRKKILPIFSVLLILIFLPFFSQIVSAERPARLIVKFKQGTSYPDRQQLIKNIRPLKSEQIRPLNIDILEVRDDKPENLIKTLRNRSEIDYVEEDYQAQALIQTNDPNLNKQWGLYTIQAASGEISAWDYTTGSNSVKIAVVDTGINALHPDLQGKIVASKNCTDSPTVDDLYGHGTHVSGIIAAGTNNSLGIAAVGYNVTLMNAKALGDAGSGYYSWIANCIVWAADNGAKVINMSLGGTASSKTLEDAINYAVAKGVTLVAAAGNSGNSSPSYPAFYNSVIAVAATDASDAKASWSNYGSWVDVAAPGVSIFSLLPITDNKMGAKTYGTLSGTSMASPFVAGLVGLLVATNQVNYSQIQNYVYNYADRISGTGTYWGYGRINALKSVKAAYDGITTPTNTPTPTQLPSKTPTPPISQTPTATPSPIPLATFTLTPTTAPTSPTPTLSPKNPWSRYCRRFPQFCR